VEQRMVTEPRDLRSDSLRSTDHQLALRGDHLGAVDGQLHVPIRHRSLVISGVLCLDRQLWPPPAPVSVGSCRAAWFSSHSARNSSRKYSMPLVIGLTAPSANAQNERPNTLSQTSNNVSMSSLVPSPATMRSSTRDIQK